MADTTATDAAGDATPLPPMQFFRAGGFDQLILQKAEHLRHLRELDPTLWVASSCPTRGLGLEPETLDFIDTDDDERIRPPEILDAVDWLLDVLKDASTLTEGRDNIYLKQINEDSEEGTLILQTIGRIHENLGQEGAMEVTLSQALDRSGIFAAVRSNGDGVIPASAAESPEVAQLINDILNTVGGELDQSGENGVTASGVEKFYEAVTNYLNWWVQGHPSDAGLLTIANSQPIEATVLEQQPSSGNLGDAMRKEEAAREKVKKSEPKEAKIPQSPDLAPEIFTLGEKTPAALAAVNAIRGKVEDYFEQVKVASFDAKAIGFFNFNDADLEAMQDRGREAVESMMGKVPLARVEPDADLPLKKGVNPVYAEALAILNRDAVAPILGEEKEAISLPDWKAILQKLAAYETWLNSKSGSEVEVLGMERLGEIFAEPERRQALDALIEVDAALAAEIEAIQKVEKLLRLHRDFFRLLRNYVSLPEFYDCEKNAIFQMGSLLIDGCMLKLCVEVDDVAKHSAIASKSGIYLVYCTCKRARETKTLTICAAVTNRDAGRITAGKNAVYYDRDGKDWDARVTQVVINPISLREAAWAPFRKISDIISAQLEKLSSSRQQALEKDITTTVTNIDKQSTTGEKAPPSTMPSNMGAMVAGGGVAIAAISSSIAYLAQTISKINDIYILYTILVILAIFITPSLLLGLFKLRRRDIGMMLEACGWAINGRMRISLNLANELTYIGKVPPGSLVLDHAYVSRAARRRRKVFWAIFFSLSVAIGVLSKWIIDRY